MQEDLRGDDGDDGDDLRGDDLLGGERNLRGDDIIGDERNLRSDDIIGGADGLLGISLSINV